MKKIIVLIVLSFFIITLYGCDYEIDSKNQTKNATVKTYHVNFDTYEYNCEIIEDNEVKSFGWAVTLLFEQKNERFILQFETKEDKAYFCMSFLDISYFDKCSISFLDIWSQLKMMNSDGEEIFFNEEEGYILEFPGSFTIYISYADASQELKDYINNDMYLINCYCTQWAVSEESRKKFQ